MTHNINEIVENLRLSARHKTASSGPFGRELLEEAADALEARKDMPPQPTGAQIERAAIALYAMWTGEPQVNWSSEPIDVRLRCLNAAEVALRAAFREAWIP